MIHPKRKSDLSKIIVEVLLVLVAAILSLHFETGPKKQNGEIENVQIHLSVSFFDATTSALSFFIGAGQDKIESETISEFWTKLSNGKKGSRRRYPSQKKVH